MIKLYIIYEIYESIKYKYMKFISWIRIHRHKKGTASYYLFHQQQFWYYAFYGWIHLIYL